MGRALRPARAALIALLLATSAGWAQSRSSLSEAQEAYSEVDYERTRRVAVDAIKRGGNDRATTSELYVLWAIAAAALDDVEAARTAFIYALASNPTLKIERTLSPKIRAPYLEARGAVGAEARPPLEVSVRRREQDLEVTLGDPLRLAAAMELATRISGHHAFSRRRFGAVPKKLVPTGPGGDLQLFAQVLDLYGNVLFELGSEEQPQQLLQVRSAGPVATPASERSAWPYYLTAGTFATLGVAAGSVATVMYLRREDRARAWNGPGCERPGATRYEQCSFVDDQRRRAEQLAVGFGATGGGFLLGSLVTLLLAPSGHEPNVALDSTGTQVVLRLGARL